MCCVLNESNCVFVSFINDSINFFVPFSKGCLLGGTSSVDTQHISKHILWSNVLLFTRVFEYSRSSTRRGLSLFGILGERDLSRERPQKRSGKGHHRGPQNHHHRFKNALHLKREVLFRARRRPASISPRGTTKSASENFNILSFVLDLILSYPKEEEEEEEDNDRRRRPPATT